MKMPETPYVYALVDECNCVFYVGKGRGRRVVSHLRDALRGKPGDRLEKIRGMVAAGHPYRFIIVSTHETDAEAAEAEVMLIEAYGRHRLVNKTDGGEIGAVVSPRDRLAARARAIWEKVCAAGHGDHPLAQIIKRESETPSYNMARWSPEKGVEFGWHADPPGRLPERLEAAFANR
jgi:hypothetical protein